MLYKVLLLVVTNAVAVYSVCNLMSITECNKYDLISNMKFHAFVPRMKWEETCSAMNTVLECAYQPKYMEGCKISETFFYDMQKDVNAAVCTDGRYMNHVNCLGDSDLEKKVKEDCIDPLMDQEATCEFLKSTRACVTNIIMTKCGDNDSKYMDSLTYTFLKPYADSVACKMDVPDIFPLVTEKTSTTKVTTKSTSSTKKTSTTTAPSTTTKTTTPSAGSILKAPYFLIPVVITKMAISV